VMKKLWPARTNKVEGPVADLDAIVSDPVPFKFDGEIHVLKPFSVQDYLRYVNAKIQLETKITGGSITPDQLVESYHAVISAVCSTITIAHIRKMQQVQVAALYQLVIDMVTGQVDTGEDKKKRKRIDLYESVRPLSSLSAAENLDGLPKRH
jgi:hypothetical protein